MSNTKHIPTLTEIELKIKEWFVLEYTFTQRTYHTGDWFFIEQYSSYKKKRFIVRSNINGFKGVLLDITRENYDDIYDIVYDYFNEGKGHAVSN